MKKNVLKDIEKIKEKRKFNNEAKNKIIGRVVANGAIGISIDIMIMAFMIAANFLIKENAIFVYNVYSIHFFICSIVTLEVAYKKDSGAWAICGIEVLALAIFTLFSPYIFFKVNNKFLYITMAIVTVYYIIKIIAICILEKKRYIQEISDITNIIKKESQDDLAQKEKEKIQNRKDIENRYERKKEKKKNIEKVAAVNQKSQENNETLKTNKEDTIIKKERVSEKEINKDNNKVITTDKKSNNHDEESTEIIEQKIDKKSADKGNTKKATASKAKDNAKTATVKKKENSNITKTTTGEKEKAETTKKENKENLQEKKVEQKPKKEKEVITVRILNETKIEKPKKTNNTNKKQTEKNTDNKTDEIKPATPKRGRPKKVKENE